MTPQLQTMYLNWLRFLQSRFQALDRLKLAETAADPKAALDLYCSLLPHLDDNARKVATRNTLYEYAGSMPGGDAPREVLDEIARLELGLGFAHKAKTLDCTESIKDEANRRRRLHWERYGGETKGLPVSRGAALVHYFKGNQSILKGRRILHTGPEPELKAWLLEQQGKLDISYEDTDPFLDSASLFLDMACMDLPGECFDMIISHRVLEHVYDDAAALRESYRVLRKGGVLNISVPISFDMEQTAEWHLPDKLRHGHLRMYGNDFPERLCQAGFEVTADRWLFTRPEEELTANNAYNMLLYNAVKT